MIFPGYATDIKLKNPYFSIHLTGQEMTRSTKPTDDATSPVIEETFIFDVPGRKLFFLLFYSG